MPVTGFNSGCQNPSLRSMKRGAKSPLPIFGSFFRFKRADPAWRPQADPPETCIFLALLLAHHEGCSHDGVLSGNEARVVLALVLESRFWSPLCLRWKWCWRLCLGRGRRRARVGTCVEVLVAVVIVLELVLVPAFRSWSPLCSRWNLCRGPGRRCACVGTSVGTCV